MNRLLTQILLVCVCLFALTSQATADSGIDAEQAYQAGDHAKLEALAKQGEIEAMLDIGADYESGMHGVAQNFKEAVKWYRMAAEQGDTEGMYCMFYMYVLGKGVKENYVLAHMWANLAATNPSSKTAAATDDELTVKVNSRRNALKAKQMASARNELAERMTHAQIAKAQELAKKCMAKKFKGCE